MKLKNLWKAGMILLLAGGLFFTGCSDDGGGGGGGSAIADIGSLTLKVNATDPESAIQKVVKGNTYILTAAAELSSSAPADTSTAVTWSLKSGGFSDTAENTKFGTAAADKNKLTLGGNEEGTGTTTKYVTVVAASVADPSVTKEFQLEVKAVVVRSIAVDAESTLVTFNSKGTIDPAAKTITIPVGDVASLTQDLKTLIAIKGEGTPTHGTDVIWTCDPAPSGSGAGMTAAGVLTFAADQGATTFTLTCKSAVDAAIKDTIAVTIAAAN